MLFEIEEGIELVNTRGEGRKYAIVQTMKKGESFFVPETLAKKVGTLRSQVGAEARNANLKVAIRPATKTDPETNKPVNGYRVFCQGEKTTVV